MDLMKRNRARELPGMLNPRIIGELFSEQCQPWRLIADKVEQDILQIVYEVTKDIVRHVTIDETASGVFYLISSGLDMLKGNLRDKFREILNPHFEGHPITYNHCLREIVKQEQDRRRSQKLEAQLLKVLGSNVDKDHVISLPVQTLFSLLDTTTETNLERFGAQLAIDYMLAYYKVSDMAQFAWSGCKPRNLTISQLALQKVVDDISVLAVEQCLMSSLPCVFQPDRVLDLTDEEVSRISEENQISSHERARYIERLEALEAHWINLKRLSIHCPLTTGAAL
jgi:hypothetical protein